MRSRVGLALLAMIIGCRDAGESTDPEAARTPKPQAASEAAPTKTTEPAPPTEPEPPIAAPSTAPSAPAPAPPPEPFVAEERIAVGGRPVAVRIDEQAATDADADAPPTRTLLVSIDGATEGDRLLAIPTGFQHCEQASAVVEPVSGEPSPLVLAQAFCERGEDEFSREIVSAVIDLGDSATELPSVRWKGDGSFSSSFGVCVRSDVPLASVPRPGILVIEQLTEVSFEPDRDLPQIRCKPKKARTRKTAEIGF